jgi:hypothetical protein
VKTLAAIAIAIIAALTLGVPPSGASTSSYGHRAPASAVHAEPFLVWLDALPPADYVRFVTHVYEVALHRQPVFVVTCDPSLGCRTRVAD